MNLILQKLSSRKLWVALLASALCMVTAYYGEELTPETVDIIKTAVGAGVAYIFGESAVDIFRQIAETMKGKHTQTVESENTIVGDE